MNTLFSGPPAPFSADTAAAFMKIFYHILKNDAKWLVKGGKADPAPIGRPAALTIAGPAEHRVQRLVRPGDLSLVQGVDRLTVAAAPPDQAGVTKNG